MKYSIDIHDSRQLPNIEAALKIIDPEAELVSDSLGFRLIIRYNDKFQVSVTAPDIEEPHAVWECQDQEILDPRYSAMDRKRRIKELIRLGIITVLGPLWKKIPPWGSLSSVRPTKIFRFFREKGFNNCEIFERLLSIYGITPAKAELLIQVGSLQERFFKPPEYISVYIGIPFCPTRCHYCSFPAVSLQTHHHLVKNYLHGLQGEIKAMGEMCRSLDLKVESIYVGGGTPTSLDEADFRQVLQWTGAAFRSKDTIEFTVEAGRPETISYSKLDAMRRLGVTRISVNPQTMQPQTLTLIGRHHTVDHIYEAINQVRKTIDAKLNMDLILGLPNETPADFLDSLDKVIALNPDNITVHTLAPKRAAQWGKQFTTLNLPPDESLVDLSEVLMQRLGQAGYLPYYLYRQRRILADLENIGYAIPGRESIYNIQMMEERQTILGLGAGAITKWVVGDEPQITRYQNAKCPATYSKRIAEDIVKKAQQTRLLLG